MERAGVRRNRMTEPDYLGSREQSFRDFFKTCAALAAPGDGALEPGSEGESKPILMAVLQTVLPFGHPRFPLSPGAMGEQFEALYSRKPGPAAAWRESLRVFNRTEGFAAVPAGALAALEPGARREYFWLWSQSAFALKRRFYRTCRGAILALAHGALPPAGP